MESLGQQKEQLSVRLKQRQEQELGEVEKLAKALLDKLKSDLEKRVTDELNTTVDAIKDAIESLPKQITDSTEPLTAVLDQARSEGAALTLVSKVWLKTFLIGVCTAVGIGLGSWGVFSWMGSEVRQLNSEISSAKATLEQLPKGVTYVKGEGGKGYILSPSMGEPFKTKSGKWAVEVN